MPTPAMPEPASPVTPGQTQSPATGEPPAEAVQRPQASRETEQPAERPRRRVRFLKPDAPATVDSTAPGTQLVPVPEPPPVVLTPQGVTAAVPAVPATPAEPAPPVASGALE